MSRSLSASTVACWARVKNRELRTGRAAADLLQRFRRFRREERNGRGGRADPLQDVAPRRVRMIVLVIMMIVVVIDDRDVGADLDRP